MTIEQWPISKVKITEILQNDKNPRTISQESFDALKESLEGLGIFKPLILRHDNKLLGGSQRTRALLEKLPASFEIYVSKPPREMTESEYDRVMLMDNAHKGQWDADKLANEFQIEDIEFAEIDFHMPSILEVEDLSDKNKEIDTDSFGNDLQHCCPKCGFEFNE